jgi:O-acetyl-ADP-ribose deacetylase
VAFPAISCGVYGFPIPRACRIALTEIRAFLERSAIPREVWLVALDATVYDEYAALLRR